MSAAYTTGSNALQIFTAAGWFGVQPLDIIGFPIETNGVNDNIYYRNGVTINGVGATNQCR